MANIYASRDFNEDAVLAERFTDTLFCEYNPAWGSTAAFRDTKDRPHLMFVMRDDIKPQGEDLLRGEALTIAAAIITRLEEFEEHKYIPILVLSFMGSLKGRIVRAYFDRKDIVIWKTKIYHFCPLEDAKK